jgi:hypothetical protein
MIEILGESYKHLSSLASSARLMVLEAAILESSRTLKEDGGAGGKGSVASRACKKRILQPLAAIV